MTKCPYCDHQEAANESWIERLTCVRFISSEEGTKDAPNNLIRGLIVCPSCDKILVGIGVELKEKKTNNDVGNTTTQNFGELMW